MIIKPNDVYALQLLHYFIEKENYQIVSVKQNMNDYWITNPENDIAPIIHIYSKPIFDLENERNYVNKVKSAIFGIIKREGTLLQIASYDMEPFMDDINVIEANFTEESISDTLINKFSDIKNIITKVEEEDSELEYLQLSKKIGEASMNNPKRIKPKKYRPSVTTAIIIVCALMFIGTMGLANLVDNLDVGFIMSGAYYKAFVLAGDYTRLLTSGLLHADVFHLLMNMVALYSLGSIIERLYSKSQYISIIIGSVLVGNLFVFVGDPNILVIGLSGGIFGLFGTLIVNSIETRSYRNPMVRSALLRVALINLIISLVPGISLLGHLGGFIGGMFIGFIYTKVERFKPYAKHVLISYIILISGLFYIGINSPYITPHYKEIDDYALAKYRELGFDFYADMIEENLNNIPKG